MRTVACLAVAVSLTVSLRAGESDGDERKLQGIWNIVDSVSNGMKEPDDGEVTVAWFDGNVIKIRQDGADAWLPFVQFKLIEGTDPKGIDLTLVSGKGKGHVTLGIYELKGNVLKLCLQDEVTLGRPKAFDSKKGSKHKLITLKKR